MGMHYSDSVEYRENQAYKKERLVQERELLFKEKAARTIVFLEADSSEKLDVPNYEIAYQEVMRTMGQLVIDCALGPTERARHQETSRGMDFTVIRRYFPGPNTRTMPTLEFSDLELVKREEQVREREDWEHATYKEFKLLFEVQVSTLYAACEETAFIREVGARIQQWEYDLLYQDGIPDRGNLAFYLDQRVHEIGLPSWDGLNSQYRKSMLLRVCDPQIGRPMRTLNEWQDFDLDVSLEEKDVLKDCNGIPARLLDEQKTLSPSV